MHYKLIPQDDVWNLVNHRGVVVSIDNESKFTRTDGYQIGIYVSKNYKGRFELVYLGAWRPCMRHILTKYVFNGGKLIDIENIKNPQYDPAAPVNIYWVRQKLRKRPGKILGIGITTPARQKPKTHQEKRNARRMKMRQKQAGEIVRTPEIKAKRADIKRQIAKFRLLYMKRQTPVAELV